MLSAPIQNWLFDKPKFKSLVLVKVPKNQIKQDKKDLLNVPFYRVNSFEFLLLPVHCVQSIVNCETWTLYMDKLDKLVKTRP